MFKLSCPSCSGEITFQSKASVYAVCSYCKSAAVRQDMDLTAYGSMADVQMDATPLQIGTVGRYEDRRFELIGRLRIRWENGFWNEWCALFDNGQEGWLAEAQGFYAINFESLESQNVPPHQELFPGQFIKLQPFIAYQVDDIKKATCIGSEGELPFPAPMGRECISVDLSARDNLFATIEYADDQVRLFYGQYVPFQDFGFTSLRRLDGW